MPTVGRGKRVYPRVCGGTSKYLWTGPTTPSLSPRVRGNRVVADPQNKVIGSIPACAGEPA